MKKRHTFQGTSWEALEDRQLLSSVHGLTRANLSQQEAALVANRTALRHSHATIAVAKTARVRAAATATTSLTPNSSNTSPGTAPTTGYTVLAPVAPATYNGLAAGAYKMSDPTGASIAINTTNSIDTALAPVPYGSTTIVSTTVTPTTTTGTATATTGTASSAVASAPAVVPGLLDGATLSKTDVAGLETAVNTFATTYTYGTSTTTDTAAIAALKAAFDNIALTAWSQTHVLPAASVTKLQQAVDSFAASYTSGTSATKDVAAWQSLQTNLAQLATSLAGSATTATAPAPGGLFAGGPVMLSGMPGMGGMGGWMVADSLLDGTALSKTDVATLQQAVNAFATAYTSGTSTSADQAAASALQNSLATLAASHMPMTPMVATAATTTSGSTTSSSGGTATGTA